MRKSKILIGILICIFLVGCSEKEEVKEELIVESTQEIGKPFDFGVHSDNAPTGALIDTYCWVEEEDDKICSIKPTPPEELLKGETHLSVAQEADVSFSFTVSDADRLYLTNPDRK